MLIVAAHAMAVFLSYTVTNLLGYWIHRWLHATKTKARASHDYHHKIYPTQDYWDEEYRHPPEEDEQIIFYMVPGVILTAASFLLFTWPIALTIVGTCVLTGKWNQYVHDSIHIKDHYLERFQWFWRLRNIHMIHHYEPYNRNLGIVSFWPDKLHYTYIEPSELDFRMHTAVTRRRHETEKR